MYMYVTTVWPNLFCQGPLTVKEVRRGYSLYLLIFNHFRGQTYYYTPEGPGW